MSKQRFGNERHPLYKRWLSMRQRCTNPNHTSYRNYGAKGITFSAELDSFKDYRDYVSSLPNYDPKNLSVDRIRGEGNYEKGNLRWTCRSTQTANQLTSGKGKNRYTGVNWSKTHNRWIARLTYKGKTLLSSVCETELEALSLRNEFIKANSLPHPIQKYEE